MVVVKKAEVVKKAVVVVVVNKTMAAKHTLIINGLTKNSLI